MGVLDFLFEGQPPQSVTTYGSTVENMPRWMSEYTQGILARANAIGSESYQPYAGPRIAGFSPEQEQAFGAVGSNVGSYQPWLNQAGGALTQAAQTFPGAVDQYMSPYVTNVTDRAAQLTNRALTEQLLPAVEGKFGAAGHDPRSSAYRRTVDRGVRDLAEGLQGQNLAALHQGYGQAGELFGADASRSLGVAQQSGALGQAAQQMGLTDAAALESVGSARQGLTQRSLDTARQDFEEQRDYPRSNVNWMQGVLQGLPYESGYQTAAQSPAGAVGPSPAGQIGSVATGIAGLLEAFKARGGMIRRGPLSMARYA
jgi:hypothetical protein